MSATLERSRLLYRVGEIVEITGYPRSVVYDLIARGVLKSVRVGRSIRVHRDDLAQFIEDHRASDGDVA